MKAAITVLPQPQRNMAEPAIPPKKLVQSHNRTGFNMPQGMPAAYNLALAHIARGAPLAETLGCIANGIEDQNPGMSCAIFLPEEDGRRLRLEAASGLPEDYRRAIAGFVLDPDIWVPQAAMDGATTIDAWHIEASRFSPDFCELALQHGLHAIAAAPIRSAADGMLGIFVFYSHQPGPATDRPIEGLAEMSTLATIAIERDIDQIKIEKAEAMQHESETRMALAIEGSGTGIWDRDISTGEIHYSTQWKAILGYTEAELSSRIEESYARVHPDDIAQVQAAIQAHFDQQTESYSVEHRIRCKDGSYKWISSRGKVASRDAEGKPLRMIGTTTDITAMRVLSDKLEQTRNQLLQSEKLGAIGQLAAGVAHEINSPIGFVSSNLGQFVEYIEDLFLLIAEYECGEPQLSRELQSSIDAIRHRIDIDFIKEDVPLLLAQSKDGIDRVQKIVRSLRDFSRIDIAQERHMCDIHTGIESTLNIVWNELKRKAHVHMEFDHTLPDIECTGSQINQVILNLLVNAAHAIESSGDIWIRTGSRDAEIFVEIADNGAGMTPEIQARIFDPFFTTKPFGEGTGLGLSVSYGIIQKHGGRIEVKSELKHGSSFTIWLPMRYPPQS